MKRTLVALVALTTIASAARAAVVTELPMLPTPTAAYAPAYTPAPRPVHINASGQIVGSVTFTRRPCARCAVQSIRRSFVIENGVATQLGIDDFIVVTNNDAGEIVGNWRDTWGTGATYAYRVVAGELVPLDTLPAVVVDLNNVGDLSYGAHINDHNISAAMMSDGEHGRHAFKFLQGAVATDLACPSTDPNFECVTGYDTGFDALHDINDGATVADAMAVGEDRNNPFSSSYGPQYAFVGWHGQMTYLSSGFTAAALAVNNLGQIVGYDNGQATVWQPDGAGGWTEYTVASLANDPSWVFSQATSVNDEGVIVGWGTHNGVPAMWSMGNALAGVPQHDPAAGSLRLAASPNPARGAVRFRGFVPALGATTASIRVMDLSGREVMRTEAPVSNGAFEATWNGLASDGSALRAGMYFAQVDARGRTGRTAIVLIR